MNFKVLATNHTSFTVTNLDRTIGFFRDALGFEVTSRAPRDKDAIQSITGVVDSDVVIAFVRGPGHSIELIEYLAPDDRSLKISRPCDTGFVHIAFDVDNVDAAIEASAAHGFSPVGPVTVIDKGPNAGNRVVYIRDADGISVEFIEKTVNAARDAS